MLLGSFAARYGIICNASIMVFNLLPIPPRRRQAVDGAPQGRAQGQGLRRRGQMGRLRDYGHGPHRGDGRDRGPRPLRDAQ